MRRAEHIELRQHLHLILEDHLLAIAERPRGPGERRLLSGARIQAVEVGHRTQRARTGPEGLEAAGIALVMGFAEIGRQIQSARIVRIVSRVHRCLVRHDEDVAETRELLRDRRHVDIAQENVLVLFLHQLVAGRHDHFHHVPAGRQHGRAIIRIRRADRAVRAIGLGVQLEERLARGQ